MRERLLQKHLTAYKAVDRCYVKVDMNDYQRAALISFHTISGLMLSKINLLKINKGDFKACKEMDRWGV